MALNTIIFDLDGTLIDSVPDVHLAINNMLAHYNLPGIPLEHMYGLIGKGAKNLIGGAFAKHQIVLEDDEVNAALEFYLDFYQANPVVNTTLYPGVAEILKEFRAASYKLGICTNKPSVMTQIVLQKLKLTEFFSVIIAGDEIAKPKPHAEHLYAVMAKMGVTNKQSVMVGDSDIDLACATSANVPFIGVSYGYHSGALQADHMIDHFSHLPDALKDIYD